MVEVRGVLGVLGPIFAAAIAVADGVRAELGGFIHGRAEVCVRRRRGLDEENLAGRANCGDHVQIERDLASPARIRSRVAGAAGLIDLLEAAIRRRARRQAIVRPVDREIGFCVRIVVRVDDGDRQAGARRGSSKIIGADQVRGAEAGGRRRDVRPEPIVGHSDLREATREARRGVTAERPMRVPRDQREVRLRAIIDLGGQLARTSQQHACG